jgi:ribosomal-protein-alanine N-acetyltransferase
MIFKFKVPNEGIYFSCLTPNNSDLNNYMAWMKNSIDNVFIESVSSDWTISKLNEFIEKVNNSESSLLVGIFLEGSNLHIGNVKFENVYINSEECSLGILIGEKEFRGRGIATKSISYLTQELHSWFEISIFKLGVHRENTAAIAAYLKAGFQINSKIIVTDGYEMFLNIK